MSALTMYQGLEERYKTIDGLRSIMLGSPSGDLDLPGLYTAYSQFARPLRNAPPASNLTGMDHLFVSRLILRWVDFQAAEMQLITFLDLIPDAIDRDPRLGRRLAGGMAYCSEGITGFATIGGVEYRIVDFSIRILEKRTGT
jgi:hypothetical protein